MKLTMTVWLKVTLLLIYLSVLFLLARMLEAVAWFEHGQISHRLLDPMALSVLKLKALLDQRGVSYDSIVEKAELRELVEATGSVSQQDLEASSGSGEEEAALTNFTGHMDFYEQVEDAKDSMWLVEVVTDTGGLLSDTSWWAIRKKVGKFGVRFGRFDCQQNARLCLHKQWHYSRLVLALPENYRSKANVGLHTYTGPVRVNALFDWIKAKVNIKTSAIDSGQIYKKEWLSCNSSLDTEVRVVFVSALSSVPLFLSALSVRFPGRVKVGNIDTSTEKGKQVSKQLGLQEKTTYLILTCGQSYSYGQGHGDRLNFHSMELFLKTLYPNMNDLFIVSFIFTNISSFFEFSLANGTMIKKSIKLLLCLFKYNVILLLIWIFLLAVVQLQVFENLCLLGLRALQFVSTTEFISLIRKDIQNYFACLPVPIFILVLMLLIVYMYKSKYSGPVSVDDEESDWWNFSNLQTLDYEQWWELTRLRPFDQIFNPTVGILSVGAEALDIHHNYMSKDYIGHLPTWVHRERDHTLTNSKEMESKVDNFQDKNDACRGTMNKPAAAGGLVDGIADSILDSNYKCECPQQCQCSEDQRNPDTQETVEDVVHPNIGPEDATLDHMPSDDAFMSLTEAYKAKSLNKKMDKPHGFLESTQCCICLDNYRMFVLLRGLPCGHVFHDKCIVSWLMRENHFCPVCRWPSFKPKISTFNDDLHSD